MAAPSARTVWDPAGDAVSHASFAASADACRKRLEWYRAHPGYLGRTPVFEIFTATTEVKQLIARKASGEELLAAARGLGLRTLREAAVRKLAEGETTFEEVMRMTTGS